MTRRDRWTVLLLGAAVMASALAVVKTKHENRTLVHRQEQLRAERAHLDTEWAQLQLEEATLAQHGRVEQIARDRLGMIEAADTVVVWGAP